MFSDTKKSKTVVDYTNEQNKIAKGTTFTGEIKAGGAFRIDGTVIGNILTKSKIVIGKTGRVEGEVHCLEADIEGTLMGTLKVEKHLNLKATCVLEGEVNTNQLSIEPGAKFNGSCEMQAQLKEIENDQKGSSKKKKSA